MKPTLCPEHESVLFSLTDTLGVFVSANWKPTANNAKAIQTPAKLAKSNLRLPILSTKKSPTKVHKKLTLATPADIQMAWVSSENPAIEIILAE